jgi:hypothetical protein
MSISPVSRTQPIDLTRVKLVLMDIDGTLVTGSELELENVSRQLSRLARRGSGSRWQLGGPFLEPAAWLKLLAPTAALR